MPTASTTVHHCPHALSSTAQLNVPVIRVTRETRLWSAQVRRVTFVFILFLFVFVCERCGLVLVNKGLEAHNGSGVDLARLTPSTPFSNCCLAL